MKKILLFLFLVTWLTGCKTVEPLYHHGNYNEAVYSYFKADEVTLEQQIMDVETILQEAQAKGKPIAPGIHAHLAMLYFEAGNSMDGARHFEMEKQLYPESIHYIDFLMSAARGSANAPN